MRHQSKVRGPAAEARDLGVGARHLVPQLLICFVESLDARVGLCETAPQNLQSSTTTQLREGKRAQVMGTRMKERFGNITNTRADTCSPSPAFGPASEAA